MKEGHRSRTFNINDLVNKGVIPSFDPAITNVRKGTVPKINLTVRRSIRRRRLLNTEIESYLNTFYLLKYYFRKTLLKIKKEKPKVFI